MTIEQIDGLKNKYTVGILMKNGCVSTLWYTSWGCSKDIVSEVLWVASDYPRREIKPL